MYIEFPLAKDHTVRQKAIPQLHAEIRVWAKTHNIDYSTITVNHSSERNVEQIYLRSDRAYELFCISWCPHSPDFRDYRLRKD